jgi:hypothetical protein
VAVKSHGDPSPGLKSTEHSLNLVTLLVKGCIMLDVQLAVLLGWAAWGYTFVNQRVTEPVGIMAQISQQNFGRQQDHR